MQFTLIPIICTYQILGNLGHFLKITIFMGWVWPKFYEDTDKAE